MGSAVTAKCQCGVSSQILVGGGMLTHTSYFPCLCECCRSVVQVNLLAKPWRCPRCKGRRVIPYDDPTLSESGESIVTTWGSNLTDGKYRCPQCGQMTLHFEDAGLDWD
jgi:predicted RNA-binding Zn-ribbon protein involved in translation (DUF1610 family)